MQPSDYYNIPAFSYSKLKAYLKSPLHGLTQEPPAESAAMRFGSAVDLAMKGQLDKVVLNPFEDGRTKAAKEFKAENAKKLVLTQSELDRVLQCVASLRSHPAVKELSLELLQPDVPLRGEFEGITLKGLPDWYFGGTLVDLKTTSGTVDASDFARTVENWHYDLQAAVYMELAKQSGDTNAAFYWISVESDKPYDVAVYKASQRVIEVGYAKLRRAIHNVKIAQNGGFLGTSDAILELTMPPWYGRKFEDPYCLPE